LQVQVSSKFQVVIPKEIRQMLHIQKHQTLQVISKGNAITLIPTKTISELRGFLSGMDTKGVREEEDDRI